jgi:hypothetical protein
MASLLCAGSWCNDGKFVLIGMNSGVLPVVVRRPAPRLRAGSSCTADSLFLVDMLLGVLLVDATWFATLLCAVSSSNDV